MARRISNDRNTRTLGKHGAAVMVPATISSKITTKVTLCMEEVGHSIGDKVMNLVSPEMVKEADRVVAITPQDTLPEFLKDSPKLEVWDIPDAGGTDLDFHRKVRDLVKQRVEQLIARF